MVADITVIVPHYNRFDSVKKALLSIHAQTVSVREILLVDDCSRPEVLTKIRKLSNLATIIENESNVGLAGARNVGISHAKSQWLAFLDDDDLFLPHKLEHQLRYIQEHPDCDVVASGVNMTRPDGTVAYWGLKRTKRLQLKDALVHTAGMVQTLLIKRDAMNAMGCFDPRRRYLEDYELGIRMVASGLKVDYLAEPLVQYFVGGRDQLTAHWSRMLKAHIAIVFQHRKLFREAFGPAAPQQMLGRILQQHGIRRGRIPGRSAWLTGKFLELAWGNPFREYN